jgi:hypothetical protein
MIWIKIIIYDFEAVSNEFIKPSEGMYAFIKSLGFVFMKVNLKCK